MPHKVFLTPPGSVHSFGGQMPLRILIVYRYPLLFQALKALVEGEGFHVMGHEDSPDAVQFAQQFQPDIVIVDFDLPGTNGLDCARQILEVSPSTRIIVLSKHTEAFRVREMLELGIRAYVLKTRTADELLSSIQEVAHGRTRPRIWCVTPSGKALSKPEAQITTQSVKFASFLKRRVDSCVIRLSVIALDIIRG
jgi:DNA-binding NarL/FixJ family response regulator